MDHLLGQKLCAVITVLVLAVGLFAHGGPTMAMSDSMAGTVAMPQTSFGQGDEGDCATYDMSEAVCYAVCSIATALLADTACIHADPGLDLSSCTSQAHAGHDSIPDPAPPKPAIVI